MKGECMCEKGEYVCVRVKIYVCKRRMYVYEMRIYVCARVKIYVCKKRI